MKRASRNRTSSSSSANPASSSSAFSVPASKAAATRARDLLDQLLECTTRIESYTCELYFREGYSYTLKFLAQGLC